MISHIEWHDQDSLRLLAISQNVKLNGMGQQESQGSLCFFADVSKDTDSSEAEYKAESDDTGELNGENFIITFKTTVGQPKDEKKPFQALEFTIMVNRKPARALADTGTIGRTLLSNCFVTTNNIPYKPRKNPVNIRKKFFSGPRWS